MEFVNTSILKNPINWVIVILMLIIAGFIVDILANFVTSKNAANGATSAA